MSDTYALPADAPIAVHTLRQLRHTLRGRNERPPYRLALTPRQWRVLEQDILRWDLYHSAQFLPGDGFPTYVLEGVEVSRLTEIYPDVAPRPAQRLPRMTPDPGWRVQFGSDLFRTFSESLRPAAPPPVSTHSTWPG